MTVNATIRMLALALLVACGASAAAKEPVAPPMTLSFDGAQYVHRWSKKGQNEFTRPAEPNLSTWHDMVTINVHEQVGNGDQLAGLANGVLGNYERSGKILRTDSRPRTPQRPAEHLVVAILSAPGVMEAAFARCVLVEGKGVVLVYSHRAYGKDAAATLGDWLTANGQKTETALMAWNRMPRLAAVGALPQSRN